MDTGSPCNFGISARLHKDRNVYITKANLDHNQECSAPDHIASGMLKVVALDIAKGNDHGTVSAKNISETLRRGNYPLLANSHALQRAVMAVQSEIHPADRISYGLLSAYLNKFAEVNPGSKVAFESDKDMFKLTDQGHPGRTSTVLGSCY
ncbi:hypothetical protein H4219_002946 [Mycoemilia scoparia]|uniref:Uncharacterized protein n=1 Tax=Mycoemilia scoparia TaxID=417184 RepID=A0A9W8A5M0_9FUNG|nr:hypothetical protein H4219_002946 [Mycoemilia scoparia]